jgi:exosome complex component RRP42
VVLETGVVSHASGSAHLRLANTDILVGVKAELETPLPGAPDRGRIEFFVDCSANATPAFEGRGGESLATSISRLLARAYSSAGCLDLTKLCVLAGQTCWILYVDILVLEMGGNLCDAVSLAVKAALASTRVPVVTVTAVDGGEPEIEVDDDPGAFHRLDVSGAPVLVTLSRIGNHCIVDSTAEEEGCSSASLVVAVTPDGGISTLRKLGGGSFHPATLVAAGQLAVAVAGEVDAGLGAALAREEALGESRERVGFL